MNMRKIKSVVLGVTAGVAIYKACEIVRRLRDEGFSVSVVMSRNAQELIKPVLFQSLSGNKVYCDLFTAGASDWSIGHIALAEKADLVLVAPATANIIGKIAGGICDDLLTCVIAATKAPVLICPAMNENMYENKITQDNIGRLKKFGYRFVGPKTGKLACGKLGSGCLADVEAIIKEIKKLAWYPRG